jgi:hypothetical protein
MSSKGSSVSLSGGHDEVGCKKSSNKWAVPLCYECHINGVERIGSRQEAAWFRERGILCLDLAAAIYANSHSLEAMLNVLRTHREKSQDVA